MARADTTRSTRPRSSAEPSSRRIFTAKCGTRHLIGLGPEGLRNTIPPSAALSRKGKRALVALLAIVALLALAALVALVARMSMLRAAAT